MYLPILLFRVQALVYIHWKDYGDLQMDYKKQVNVFRVTLLTCCTTIIAI